MKKLFLGLVMFCVSLCMFAQNEEDFKQTKKFLENKIEYVKSEIKTCQLKLKIDKSDSETLFLLTTDQNRLKVLKENLKETENALQSYKNYMKSLKSYNKDRAEYEKNLEIYRNIDLNY